MVSQVKYLSRKKDLAPVLVEGNNNRHELAFIGTLTARKRNTLTVVFNWFIVLRPLCLNELAFKGSEPFKKVGR